MPFELGLMDSRQVPSSQLEGHLPLYDTPHTAISPVDPGTKYGGASPRSVTSVCAPNGTARLGAFPSAYTSGITTFSFRESALTASRPTGLRLCHFSSDRIRVRLVRSQRAVDARFDQRMGGCTWRAYRNAVACWNGSREELREGESARQGEKWSSRPGQPPTGTPSLR